MNSHTEILAGPNATALSAHTGYSIGADELTGESAEDQNAQHQSLTRIMARHTAVRQARETAPLSGEIAESTLSYWAIRTTSAMPLPGRTTVG
jgi:hypothetical protein